MITYKKNLYRFESVCVINITNANSNNKIYSTEKGKHIYRYVVVFVHITLFVLTHVNI